MTRHKMSIFGVGPWFVLLSAVYTAAAITAKAFHPELLRFPYLPHWILVLVGIALLVVGIPFFGAALAQLIRGFPKGELFTSGVYATCRHPVYGAWVVFNVPGMVLIANSWIGLLVPVLMYATLRLLVRKEERDLEETFGEAYRRYRSETPAVFPFLWRWR